MFLCTLVNLSSRTTSAACVHCHVTLIFHWKGCGKSAHVRPQGLRKDHVVKRFSPGPSYACLFRALQAPCGIARISYLQHGSSPQLCPAIDRTHAHRVMFFLFRNNPAAGFCCLNGVALSRVSFGVLWTVSQVSLTYFTTYFW